MHTFVAQRWTKSLYCLLCFGTVTSLEVEGPWYDMSLPGTEPATTTAATVDGATTEAPEVGKYLHLMHTRTHARTFFISELVKQQNSDLDACYKQNFKSTPCRQVRMSDFNLLTSVRRPSLHESSVT